MNTLSPSLQEAITQWRKWNRDEDDEHKLEALLKDAPLNLKKLEASFNSRLKFGTAGLRALMDVGPANMNCLSVIQVSQGIVQVAKKYLKNNIDAKEKHSKCQLDCSVVVGYDGRRKSDRFSQLARNVFMNAGFKVYYFGNRVTPTPLVPFAVTLTSSCFGVMITASHNPKDDNGYKLYWNNGVQIISPLDTEIELAIAENLEPLPGSWASESDCSVGGTAQNQVEDIYEKALQTYLDQSARALDFSDITNCEESNKEKGEFDDDDDDGISKKSTDVKFTYTAMHGVGFEMAKAIFKRFSLPDLIPVESQVYPDPDFPTVVFPNPEEGERVKDDVRSENIIFTQYQRNLKEKYVTTSSKDGVHSLSLL